MIRVTFLVRVFLSLLLLWPMLSWAAPELQPITLQLRWLHQFQFAGYHMAKEKGFYQREGLDVTILPGGPGIAPADEVLNDRAKYGVGNMEVLSLYVEGKPLVALAAIYQHSPSILLVRSDSQIYTVRDLKGKRVMLFPGYSNPELLGMMRMQGVEPDDIQRLETSTDINDLINGKTDAFNAYLTNEPFFMQEKGIGVRIINPRDHGVDFYSDVLFTTQQELQKNPDRVAAFRRASLKGWRYALDHPEEAIQILADKYQVNKTLSHLRYESNMVREMTMSTLVELGYMSNNRWESIAHQMAQLGIISDVYSLSDFIYSPASGFDWQRWAGWIASIVALLAVFSGLSLWLFLTNRKLGIEVAERIKAENYSRHLALHDSLTGLPNRTLLIDRLGMICKGTLRNSNYPVLLFIDLDDFKAVNDGCGHDVGDKLLCDVAQILKEALRDSDTVSRFGGDEFVVLLDNIASTNEVVKIIKKLLGALKLPLYCAGQPQSVTASIGMIRIETGDTPTSVLKKADQAMYYIKERGKNSFADYNQLHLCEKSSLTHTD